MRIIILGIPRFHTSNFLLCCCVCIWWWFDVTVFTFCMMIKRWLLTLQYLSVWIILSTFWNFLWNLLKLEYFELATLLRDKRKCCSHCFNRHFIHYLGQNS